MNSTTEARLWLTQRARDESTTVWYDGTRDEIVLLEGARVWFKPDTFWELVSTRGELHRKITSYVEAKERLHAMNFEYLGNLA